MSSQLIPLLSNSVNIRHAAIKALYNSLEFTKQNFQNTVRYFHTRIKSHIILNDSNVKLDRERLYHESRL